MLANFFTKSAIAASQVLQGFDPAALQQKLESCVVGIAFDHDAAKTTEGKAAAGLAVNLLSRFYPRIGIVDLTRRDRDLTEILALQARAINPAIEILDDVDHVTGMLAIGGTRACAPAVFYLGSDGWIVKLSSKNPVGSGDSGHAFGAGTAVCFGTANLFRTVFDAELGSGGGDEFAVSLIDLVPNAQKLANPSERSIDLGETHLVGAGAIGNATVWALRETTGLRGELLVIDGEKVDLSNLQRYVLTVQGSIEKFKVDIVAEELERSHIRVQPQRVRWGEYLAQTGRWNLKCVAVAVDSAEDRCAIQASLPATILNVWTQPGDLGISRHFAFGRDACLTCLYLPRETQKSEDELVAVAIRMPDRQPQVRQLLYTGEPVPPEFFAAMAVAIGVQERELEQFRGAPLRHFYSQAVCGGLVMRLGGQTGSVPIQAHVPMAFQSALAGILLGAEMVINTAGLRSEPVPASTRLDLLKPLPSELCVPVARDSTDRCICADPDYVASYNRKYT
jgi:hypothetical protein